MRRLSILLVLLLAGCSGWPRPWVAPYERELLADPVMDPARDPLVAGFRSHVEEVREGAQGAGMTEGGGCGCN